jgi:hypothetical protein
MSTLTKNDHSHNVRMFSGSLKSNMTFLMILFTRKNIIPSISSIGKMVYWPVFEMDNHSSGI